MGLFGSNGDTVDLTLLQKKGILGRAMKEEREGSSSVVDLSALSGAPSISAPIVPSSEAVPTALSFFDSVTAPASTPSFFNSSEPSKSSSDSAAQLAIKIDDLEFKLERLIERLEKLEGKS
ncbi:MAG TPA: hypothetical protein VJK51_03070 [Candidatus Nanoarchaeia archaeon]|nr:hypothetical protein [Candidatus Nanoarchaeia archaeon]